MTRKIVVNREPFDREITLLNPNTYKTVPAKSQIIIHCYSEKEAKFIDALTGEGFIVMDLDKSHTLNSAPTAVEEANPITPNIKDEERQVTDYDAEEISLEAPSNPNMEAEADKLLNAQFEAIESDNNPITDILDDGAEEEDTKEIALNDFTEEQLKRVLANLGIKTQVRTHAKLVDMVIQNIGHNNLEDLLK